MNAATMRGSGEFKDYRRNAIRLLSALRSPGIVVIAALAIRVCLVSHYVGFASGGGSPCGHNEPSHIAAHLARGEGFSSPYIGVPLAPTAQQPPLYPVLLAGVFRLFGVCSLTALWIITEINALVGAGISLLICAVGERYISRTVGLIAAWIWALSPAIVATDLVGSIYPLSASAVLIWLLILPKMLESANGWMVLGVALGLMTLLNPMLLIVLPASAGWLLTNRKHSAAMVLVSMLLVATWIVRNYLALGHFYPVRDNFGLELFIGNHSGMREHLPQNCAWNLCDGTADYGTADFPDHSQLYARAGEAKYMQARLREAMAYIRAEPRAFLVRSVKRALSFWLLPYPWCYLLTFLLMCVGISRISGSAKMFFLTMLALYPISFYVTHVAWVASYRHPIEPLMLLSAGAALSNWGVAILSSTSRMERSS